MKMNRREFLEMGMMAGAVGLGGCATRGVCVDEGVDATRVASEFHVFSKMFQSPVTKSPEQLCDLMAAAGFDGVQWTVRPGGHVEPTKAAVDLPRLCRIAEQRGLRNRTICTAIKPGDRDAADILKAAADCGITMHRPAYFFYEEKTESFRESMDRFRRGFAELAALGERTGVKATYQNHSSWGPSVFGGLLWDVYECVRDIDPKYIGVEYDPMHAYFETNLSWTHGFDLVAPWIAAIDLKDFHYRLDAKKPKMMKKQMVGAGEGIVPWEDVRRLQEKNGVKVPYILHFEYDFDKTDLKKTVKNELDAFRKVYGVK